MIETSSEIATGTVRGKRRLDPSHYAPEPQEFPLMMHRVWSHRMIVAGDLPGVFALTGISPSAVNAQVKAETTTTRLKPVLGLKAPVWAAALVDLLAYRTTLKQPVSIVGQHQAIGPIHEPEGRFP
jgi:hypothetical protein